MRVDNLNELFAAFVKELEAAPPFATLTLEVIIHDGQAIRAEVIKRRTYLVPENGRVNPDQETAQ